MCGGQGQGILELLPDDDEDDDWEEIRDQRLGPDVVRIVREQRYLRVEDVLGLGVSLDAIEDVEPLDGQMFSVVKAPMGIGKSTVLMELFCTPRGIALIMRLLGIKDVINEQPSVVAITPRISLADSAAHNLGLVQLPPGAIGSPKPGGVLCRAMQAGSPGDMHQLAREAGGARTGRGVRCADPRRGRHERAVASRLADAATGATGDGAVDAANAQGAHRAPAVCRQHPEVDADAAAGRRLGRPFNQIPNLSITVCTRGIGGIQGHQMYMSDKLQETVRVLKMYLAEGKCVYVPTNKKRFAERLYALCRDCLGLDEDEMVLLSRDSPKELMDAMINDPARRLGFKKDADGRHVVDGTLRRVRVFFATPKFGVGFNLSAGLLDATVAFFFTRPVMVPENVQHLARAREVTEKTIVCYYESRRCMVGGTSRRAARNRVTRQVVAYERQVERGAAIADPTLRDYAIGKYVLEEEAKRDAAGMFAAAVAKETGRVPLDLLSFVCREGGAVRDIPPLTEHERSIIGSKGAGLDEEGLPTTQREMMELLARQSKLDSTPPQKWRDLPPEEKARLQLTATETEVLSLYRKLPVPAGLLRASERQKSFVRCLDTLWRVLEVTASGEQSLQHMDAENGRLSADVSHVRPDERAFQQYRVYDVWARLVLCSVAGMVGVDGTILLAYICSRCTGSDAAFSFQLDPGYVREDEVAEIAAELATLADAGADTKVWFERETLDALCRQITVKEYAKIVRKGFRLLFGVKNVAVRVVDGTLDVRIENLQRLISLACVRRIWRNCNNMRLTDEGYELILPYRDVGALAALVPRRAALDRLCGIEDDGVFQY